MLLNTPFSWYETSVTLSGRLPWRAVKRSISVFNSLQCWKVEHLTTALPSLSILVTYSIASLCVFIYGNFQGLSVFLCLLVSDCFFPFCFIWFSIFLIKALNLYYSNVTSKSSWLWFLSIWNKAYFWHMLSIGC